MRKMKLAMAMAMPLLLASAISSCGSKSMNTLDTAPAARDASSALDTQDDLDTLYGDVFGTPAERGAGNFEVNYAANHDAEVCMRDRGFDYTWTYVDPWATWSLIGAGGEGSQWLAALGGTPISSSDQALASVHRDLAKQEQSLENRDSQDPNFGDALRACNIGNETKALGVASVPTGAYELLKEFHAMRDAVDARFTSELSTYVSCMSDAGWDVTGNESEVEGYPSLLAAIDRAAPNEAFIPAKGEAGGAQWQEFLAYESKALTADADCRAATHEKALAQLATSLSEFQANHSGEIREVQAGWQVLVHSATSHGWVPAS